MAPFWMVLVAALTTISQSTSRRAAINAQPLGAPVPIIIQFGEQYLGSELYDAKITVIEVLRGEKAWRLVKQASPSNSPPITGFDYILARVKFEFSARTLPAPDRYDLNETQFTATDRDGHDLSVPALVAFPQPRLNATRGRFTAGLACLSSSQDCCQATDGLSRRRWRGESSRRRHLVSAVFTPRFQREAETLAY